ncbi:eukaryotic translation initiation factor 3 subunit J-B isoform X1 [Rhinichthys klamathensis goyatoka]|uniref:eukaryotic translation initiation factor 3 subunit J-B isoform X1 n=1 Tax=Rhinichthys klamathensis goyatoka TaxID=3034132 RepID=UPI0024B5C372|nr:eukaryotic translation initiation factor 3 subunit J-B isoform X1 [Rhinichthys klamathensis goyatoka]
MADADDWDADSFDPSEPIVVAAALVDKWEGEDEEEDVKDNWDDDEEEKEEEKKVEQIKAEVKPPEKKKLSDKIKEKELAEKKKQDELRKKQESAISENLSPEELIAEKLRLKKLQEEADLELAREAFGVDPAAANSSTTVMTTNNDSGIEAMCPSSKDDFVAFEKLLKDKITQFEKSVHYSSFLESLFRELCISLEVDDLKKINTTLSALLNEKQKQEKEKKANKKKKKGVLPSGGLKAKMKDDIADYGEFDGGYGNDYDDFM